VPIYVYRCGCGMRFERLMPLDSDPPACPDCGGATSKIQAGSSLGGRSLGAGPGQGRVPPPWQGIAAGGPERMQREVAFRQRLQEQQVRAPSEKSADGTGATGSPTASA
jgi:putative FmdB family regulatory protein